MGQFKGTLVKLIIDVHRENTLWELNDLRIQRFCAIVVFARGKISTRTKFHTGKTFSESLTGEINPANIKYIKKYLFYLQIVSRRQSCVNKLICNL